MAAIAEGNISGELHLAPVGGMLFGSVINRE
jgi:hypothetical protein